VKVSALPPKASSPVLLVKKKKYKGTTSVIITGNKERKDLKNLLCFEDLSKCPNIHKNGKIAKKTVADMFAESTAPRIATR
jgi:hypothetical protein